MLDRFVTLRGQTRHGLKLATLAALLATTPLAAGPAAAAPNAAIVVDAKTGKVLYSSNADARRFPASLTKMMTLYMLFESIDSGRTGLTTPIKVSATCAGRPPSKLGFSAGQTIPARDAVLALVTKSANDVACAIGEHLAGSESTFGQTMTKRARLLGMSNTTFRNASGLPDSAQVTTARDMATLGRALQDHFPHHFKYFSTRSFKWKGNTIGNHNRLLGSVQGVDGIKTGYTRASGFNLVSTVKRNNREIVAVVIGGDTGRARDQRMAGLIEEYLPKASRGRRTAPMIAGAPGAVSLGKVYAAAVPLPRKRPINPEPITTASVVGANSIFALAAMDEGHGEGDTNALDEVDAGSITSAIVASAPIDPDPAPMPAAPAAAAVAEGWKIQLAATPTEASALEILERARSTSPGLLGSASPYTETVVRENVTLYRARFAGFAGKDEARSACAQLVKQKFACLALSN